MAARTASVSGKWSQTATWGGSAVPVDGDTVTINAGVLVEFDVDQSGFATGLGAQTINGTLFASRTAGSYYWKCAGSIAWGSTSSYLINNGAGGAYPQNCTFQQFFNGNFTNSCNASAVIDIRCAEPTHKYVKLTVAAAGVATVLTVDTDLTAAGDSGAWLWSNPSLVRVDDINQAVESEQYTISSISSTQITLTSGLTNAKSIGAYIVLASRNVKIFSTSTANGIGFSTASNGTINAEIRLMSTGVNAGTGCTIGGAITGCATGIGTGTSHTFNGAMSSNSIGWNNGTSGIINGLISGCATVFNGGTAMTLSITGIIAGCGTAFTGGFGPIVNGTITGCTNGIISSFAPTVTGTITNCGTGIASVAGGVLSNASITGCTSGLNSGSGQAIRSCTFSSNSRDLLSVHSAAAYNTLFGSGTEFLNYNAATRTIWDYVESIDHDQVAGAFRSWCRGGIVSSVTGTVYDASRPRSYQHVPESASSYVFMKKQVLVPAFGSLYVRCYVQKDVSMSYLPRLWVMTADKEPLISGSPDSEVLMTNSTNTWEVLESTVTNNTDSAKLYEVRTVASNASGNVYFDPIIRVSSFQITADMSAGMVA